MRCILTLVTLTVFSFNVTAMVDPPQENNRNNQADERVFKRPVVSTSFDRISPTASTGTTILYKMRDNIIRRELSFTLGKKWMKWA